MSFMFCQVTEHNEINLRGNNNEGQMTNDK